MHSTEEVSNTVNKSAVLRRYYTPKEVSTHNSAEDCWVSVFNQVYDVTKLIEANRGQLAQPIIQHAGEDLSLWFDPETKDVKTHFDPERSITCAFLPHGRFLHVPPPEPVTNWSTGPTAGYSEYWWNDPSYSVGSLTKKTRWIQVLNVLTQQEKALEVCSEETINEIQDRYLEWNSHAASYTWKHLQDNEFVPLDMTLTLEENGIEDESEKLERLGIAEEDHRPIIHIYFNDDLTVI